MYMERQVIVAKGRLRRAICWERYSKVEVKSHQTVIIIVLNQVYMIL
nr:MAG TPA: hypothetical protein [Bacteriophage sp.]